MCKDNTVQRTTTINIMCDPHSTGTETGTVSEGGSIPCQYTINMKHKAACPGSANGGGAGTVGGLSGGSVFLIM